MPVCRDSVAPVRHASRRIRWSGLAWAVTTLCLVTGLSMPALLLASSAAAPSTAARAAPVADSLDESTMQTLIVSPHAPRAEVFRDGYGVTLAPTLVWPIEGQIVATDGFGLRQAPCSGCSAKHEGVDFRADEGVTVRAIADGVVSTADHGGPVPLGIHVVLEHVIAGHSVSSTYGHLQIGSRRVEIGDQVTVGQIIGRVGSTGLSTGPHLHFEIRLATIGVVDPAEWMMGRLP